MIYILYCIASFFQLQLQCEKHSHYINNILNIIIAFLFYSYFILYSKLVQIICIQYCNINFIFFSQTDIIEKLKTYNIDVIKNNIEYCSYKYNKLLTNFLILYFFICIFQLHFYFYLCVPIILLFYTFLFFYKYKYSLINTSIIYLTIIILQNIKGTRLFNGYSGYIFCIILFTLHSILYSINLIQNINECIEKKYKEYNITIVYKNKCNIYIINLGIYFILLFCLLFSSYCFQNCVNIINRINILNKTQ